MSGTDLIKVSLNSTTFGKFRPLIVVSVRTLGDIFGVKATIPTRQFCTRTTQLKLTVIIVQLLHWGSSKVSQKGGNHLKIHSIWPILYLQELQRLLEGLH